jgi:protein-tyrosine phosphatase
VREFDLRTPQEQELDGVVSGAIGAQLRTLPLLTSLWVPSPADDPAEYLAARYIEMFLDCTPKLAEIIETIVREPGPVVFHCMAGKDRTGIVAATILDLLGVADETILHDYALSESEMPRLRTLFEERFPQRPIPAHANLFNNAPVRSLAQAIDYVRSERGSVQQLLRDAGMSLGTIAALRTLLLQH